MQKSPEARWDRSGSKIKKSIPICEILNTICNGEKSSLNDILNVSKIISCNLYVNEGNFVIPSEAVQTQCK